MRDILFRGKRIDNGEWVYGDLLSIPTENKTNIIEKDPYGINYKVIPETIGQYTGLTDKNGKKIFEGDLLRFPPKNEWEKTNFEFYEVFYHDNNCCNSHVGFQFNRIHFHGALCGKDIGFAKFRPEYTQKMIIIGNIYDNPELLEDKK